MLHMNFHAHVHAARERITSCHALHSQVGEINDEGVVVGVISFEDVHKRAVDIVEQEMELQKVWRHEHVTAITRTGHFASMFIH